MVLRYPPFDASAATGFGGNDLDRRSERRDEAAFVAKQIDDLAAEGAIRPGDVAVF